MSDIAAIIRAVQLELSPMFEEKLREQLANKDRQWLIDQIVRLTLDQHSLQEIDRRAAREAKASARAARIERVRALAVDAAAVRAFVAEHGGSDRAALQRDGQLAADAPAKGEELLGAEHRSPAGEQLLERAKDMLFALLFGDERTGTRLARTRQVLLTFALPRAKSAALTFLLRASTELPAAGTWQDPADEESDERSDNVLLEVQYGDTEEKLVGDGVIAALRLINHLEVNEKVLYARTIDVAQTTLIE